MNNIKIKMKAKVLKNMLNIINTVSSSDSAHRIKFNKTDISFNSVDPAHVAMINQVIPVKNIEEYQFKKEVEIGLDITKILNSLKNIKKTDIIDIDYIGETSTIYTKLGPFNNKINTLDLEGMPDPKTPVLDLPCTATINLKEFYDFIDQAGKISDYVEISTYNNKLFLFAENDTDQVKVIYDKKDLKQLEARDKGQVYISLFSVDYLKMIVRHLKTQYNECTLVFGTDNPIKIICKNRMETEVLLAPRIESEEITNKDRVKREYNDIEEIKEDPEVKPEVTVKKEPEPVKTEAEEEKEIIADIDNNLYPNGEKPQEEEVKEEIKKLESEIKEKETSAPEIKPNGDIVEIKEASEVKPEVTVKKESETVKTEAEEEKEIDAYMTKSQKEEIDKLQQELKRIRGEKLANEEIQKMKDEIELMNKKNKMPKNKLLKGYVSGMKKVIAWWNMEGLTEEEKQAKKERFNKAGGMFLGNDSASERGMPSLFGNNYDEGEDDEIMDHPFNMFSDRPKPRRKTGGKHTKKRSTRQKNAGYVVINGVAYPKAAGKTKKKTSKKKKVVKKKTKPRREREEEPEPFFNLLR